MDATILVVEDDRSIRDVTEIGLRDAGFCVVTAADGDTALAMFRAHAPDVVVLDVMLPHRDGFDVLRAIRGLAATPVVMVTARTDTSDVILGLELGADDYVTKPFAMPELVARVRAARRRGQDSSLKSRVMLGPIEVDVEAHRVNGPDGEIALTPTEFRLLTTLASAPGRTFTRDILLQQVWDYRSAGDTRLVDVAIQRLRAKVEADPSNPVLIETVRGFGYRGAASA